MSEQTPLYPYSVRTGIGTKDTVNEDSFGIYEGAFGFLLIVCDGMGVRGGGDIASHIAVIAVKEHLEGLALPYNPRIELQKAIQSANQQIFEYASNHSYFVGMGSTACLLLIYEGQAYLANVGNSRAYMMTMNEIRQITVDHTIRQKWLDDNLISEGNVPQVMRYNALTRSLGGLSTESDVFGPFPIYHNERYLLCTDGLTDVLTRLDIWQITRTRSLESACTTLMDILKQKKAPDCCTFILLEIQNNIPRPIDPQIIHARKANEKTAKFFLYATILYFLYTFSPIVFSDFFDANVANETIRAVASGFATFLKNCAENINNWLGSM